MSEKPESDSRVMINLLVERIAPDRNQYKPYGLVFAPQKLLVSVPVTGKNVKLLPKLDEDGKPTKDIEYVCLNLDGLMELTGTIANSVDELHAKYLKNLMRS